MIISLCLLVLLIGMCLCSCGNSQTMATDDDALQNDTADLGNWSVNEYTDEFGDSTGTSFCYSICLGTFENSATSGSDLAAGVYYDPEKDVFLIRLLEYQDHDAAYLSSSEISMKCKVDGYVFEDTLMEYSAPSSEPAIVVETPITFEERTEEKLTAPAKPKSQKPVTTSGTKPAPQSRSVTDQYVKKQSPASVIKLKEVAEEDTQKEIDCLTVLVIKGATVKHISFGAGKITKVDYEKKRVRIKFDVSEKMFLFPDAFLKGYLSF